MKYLPIYHFKVAYDLALNAACWSWHVDISIPEIGYVNNIEIDSCTIGYNIDLNNKDSYTSTQRCTIRQKLLALPIIQTLKIHRLYNSS